MSLPLWAPTPEQKAQTHLSHFITRMEQQEGMSFPNYASFYDWTVANPETFWKSTWEYHQIIGDMGSEPYIKYSAQFEKTSFFPTARLNFAQNLLRRQDHGIALLFWGEDKISEEISYKELSHQVIALAKALKDLGVEPGDRVAAALPNIPQSVVAMLATTALGAIWCACSPDFGVDGILDRFQQLSPKIFIGVDGYYYSGKTIPTLDRVKEALTQLPTVEKLLLISYVKSPLGKQHLPENTIYWDQVISTYKANKEIFEFELFPFNHPLYILFSSGTTGKPKCITHGAGGTLLEHLKEHQFHCDIQPNDRVFYFTTVSWMMWHWLISALASQATVVLYDGSPLTPNPTILFDYADKVKMTLFGTSAKYIDALQKMNITPIKTHSLSSLRMICSTGSPLAPTSFDFVYEHIKKDVCLSSISGGTDILGCFVLGNPNLAVWRGELQSRSLGIAVNVFDEDSHPVKGQKGDLVCTAPFPSMPVGFWGDETGEKYHEAYFDRFPNVWCHGDFVELTPHDGMIIYGRSDALLKPGGVRIGTAEIYRQVEQVPEVLESIAVGQEWDNDIRVILFVKLKEGLSLDGALIHKIKDQIRDHTTPRHVPSQILQVDDIPRTKNGKIVELAVREVIHGRPVKNLQSLANPEALAHFQQRPELKS
jgi:acetoacetyl-CoA synthetase